MANQLLDPGRLLPLAAVQRRSTRAAMRLRELPLVLALLLAALLAHGLNMFNYPATYGDEGIYVAQALAVLREGRLAPYTYWYDHAPAGWIIIAAWMGLSGGPLTFGGSIDSGRVLMLLLHLAMVLLLYRVTRKLSGSTLAAVLATLLFSLSPLAVFYQRLVLLDNIMLFWLLLSLELLLDGWGRLSRFVASGVCFGLAVLSKETAVFLVPALLMLAWQQRWQHHGRFALVGWLVPMLITVSLYPLFALLKGELLPAGQAIGFLIFNIQSDTGISLIDSLRWQASRGGGGVFNLNNMFWQLVRGDWLPRDPLLLLGGMLATVVNLLRGLRDRRALVAGLLGALPLLYLARGGLVFDFYIIFAIPFFCLNLALLAAWATRPLERRIQGRFPLYAVPLSLLAALLLTSGYWASGRLLPLYSEHPGLARREAVAWMKRHVPAESRIVVRDDLWPDLREDGLGGPAFPNTHSHWKVDSDPDIRGGVFNDDWRRIDYVVMSQDQRDDLEASGNSLTLEALDSAQLLQRWERDGQPVELWKVDQPGLTEQRLLTGSATHIDETFEHDGAYIDAEGVVTSEAQSYALLRAVWSDDRTGFMRAWDWTRTHLQRDDGLLAWRWRNGGVDDPHSAADADVDTALALLLAGRRWDDAALTAAGTALAQAIWEHEVVIIGNRPYLSAGDWAKNGQVIALNPSYMAPYAYRVFQQADPGHNWHALVDTSYQVLSEAVQADLGSGKSVGLPPDWIGLQRDGRLVPLSLEHTNTTSYGYDAARVYWRVALDQRWSGDERATAFLESAGFLRDEFVRQGRVAAVYRQDGAVVSSQPSLVGNAGALAALLTLDPATAGALYTGQIVGVANFEDERVSWGDPQDLYGQSWGWFATALYADALPNFTAAE